MSGLFSTCFTEIHQDIINQCFNVSLFSSTETCCIDGSAEIRRKNTRQERHLLHPYKPPPLNTLTHTYGASEATADTGGF